MTTSQKIHFLRAFETILNMLDESQCLPFGIVTIHETDNDKLGFSPIHIQGECDLTVYAQALNRLSVGMLTQKPSKVIQKEVNPLTQNLN